MRNDLGNSTGEESKEEDSADSDSDAPAAPTPPPAANQFGQLMADDMEDFDDFEADDDDDDLYGYEYYDEDGLDYYDELDDEDYYDDEEDDIPLADAMPNVGPAQDVEINVNISDKKNDIVEVPVLEQHHMHKDAIVP